jgi:hypothetical protein
MQNITSATTTVLNVIGEGDGNIKLKVVNNHTADSQISAWLNDGTSDFYIIKNLVMPTATAVVLDDMKYDSDVFSLKLQTHSATTSITITTLRP